MRGGLFDIGAGNGVAFAGIGGGTRDFSGVGWDWVAFDGAGGSGIACIHGGNLTRQGYSASQVFPDLENNFFLRLRCCLTNDNITRE